MNNEPKGRPKKAPFAFLAVNVADFGASGCGTSDDYPAFVAAVNALADSGGVVVRSSR